MDKEITMEEKLRGLTLLQQLLESINNNIEEMAEKRALLAGLKVALGQFKANENEEILVQFSQGIYVEAKMVDKDRYIVGVGSNTLVEKTRKETEEYITKKIGEIESSIIELQSQFRALEEQLIGLYNDVKE
ncbi:MAG: prefoldin subunit alpha [Candidatus Woesearchaeota archaeon]